MLDELLKALGPWPLLQVMFGVIVFGTGIYAVTRGAQKGNKDSVVAMEDKRAEWEALQTIKNIQDELKEQTALLRTVVGQMNSNADAMRALAATLHNESQWPRVRN